MKPGWIVPPLTNQRQALAADPGLSAWVSANAGSGKTHVLVNRVLRLLLDGVQPSRMLCITYTKAAAANMANRIFKALGSWATLDEERLGKTLADVRVVVDGQTYGKGVQVGLTEMHPFWSATRPLARGETLTADAVEKRWISEPDAARFYPVNVAVVGMELRRSLQAGQILAAGMLAPTAARGVGPNRPQRHQSQCGQRFRSILHRVAEWSDHIRRLDGVPVTASRP